MSRDTAGPRAGQEPETGWRAVQRRGGRVLSLSASPAARPCLPALARSVSHCEPICFAEHRIPELTCPPGPSASKDLQAPLHSNTDSRPEGPTGPAGGVVGGECGVHLHPINSASEQSGCCGRGGGVPGFPEKEGSLAASVPRKCLDAAPAAIGPILSRDHSLPARWTPAPYS